MARREREGRRGSGLELELKQDVLGFHQVYGIMIAIMVAASTLAFLPVGWTIAGPAFIVSMVIACLASLIAGLNFIELALLYRRASSFVDYFNAAFGRWAGPGITLAYIVTLSAAGAGSFVLIGDFLHELIPELPWWLWGLVFYLGLFTINVIGVEVFGWSQVLATAAMIGTLIVVPAIALLGLAKRDPTSDALTPFLPEGASIFSGALLAVFLFVGFEVLGPLVEEVRRPTRTLPLALLATLGTVLAVMVLFFVVQITTADDVGELAGLPGPQNQTGEILLGAGGLIWLTIISVIAEGSSVNSAFGANSRLLLALGRQRDIPKFFGLLHPSFRTPWVALALLTPAMITTGLIAGHDGFLDLFILATYMWLGLYFLFCAAVIVLRWRAPGAERPFSVGGPARLPLVSLAGLVLMAVVFVETTDDLDPVPAIVAAAICVIYGIAVSVTRSLVRRGDSGTPT
jgi:amino acid transporter